jgi:hypothetical protein
MLAPVVLLALLVAAPIALPPTPNAMGAVPDEPGAFVLPDAPILQTVAADLDGDGRRELIRLIRGDDDAALAEVWVERGSSWALLGEPVEVVPPSRVGTRIDPVFQATPVRLLVRRVDGAERVTVASQPHFEEIDVGEPCCLLLHDLVIEPGGGARRQEVAESSDFADAVLVIDLDGDGTDELLATQSLPPLGDIGFPTRARVHRWADGAFAAPIVTELSIGSGDAPFLLGDSDGIPGEEAAIISTLGRSGLFRISAGPGDELSVDPAGLTADQALAVPLADGRGVAVTGPVVGFIVALWPAGRPMSPSVGTSQLSDVRLLGTLAVEGEPRLAVHRPSSATLHLLGLPELTPWRETSIARSLAAARLSARPPDPYVGLVPDGAGVIHAGRLVAPTAVGDPSTPAPMATLAGAEPIGFVGDGTALAVHHAPLGPAAPGPEGGPLTVPAALPLAWTSIVPFDLVRTPETDVGALDAEIRGAVRLDAGNDVAVGRDGLTAEVFAPAGSRVLVSDGASVSGLPVVVPEGGVVEIRLGVATNEAASTRRRARLVVTTPAGHAYLAAWDILIVSGPPPIEAEVATPFGSPMVEIRGVTLSYATVRVDGHPVEVNPAGRFSTRVELPPWPTDIAVEVDDTLGNVARTMVTGVGWFDYRGLPWVPIVAAVVGLAALVLLLRVPRLNPLPRPADDDSALEELEPD